MNCMVILSKIITMFVIFFAVNYAAYWITEVKGLPQWLQYKPWICRLCLTFWSLVVIYLTILLSFQCLYLGIGGIILAVMNALAMYIDQKQKTIRIEDYDDFKPYDISSDDKPLDIEINDGEIIINKNIDR